MNGYDQSILDAFELLISDPEAEIPQKVTNRALLLVMANLRSSMDEMGINVQEGCDENNRYCARVEKAVLEISNNHIPHLNVKIDNFIKDEFAPLRKRVEENPSLMWMLRYQTSKTMKLLLTIVVLLIIFTFIFWTVVPLRVMILALLGLPTDILNGIATPIP